MNDFFTTRHTVRQFSDKPVDNRLLLQMIEAASHAPTTGNMQLYSVVITRTPEGKGALAPAHFNQPCVTGCDVLLTFCADYNRFIRWCEQRQAEPGYDNFQSFMTAVIDTVIFAQQFCTLAEMEGLGVCYLGTTTYNAPQIAEVLALPSMVVPVITLAVGYPAAAGKVSDRLPVEGIIHQERYGDYTSADIDSIYALKESLEESAKFVAENDKQTLAQVFTDVRYTRQACEYFSKVYHDFIEKSGYKFPKQTD